MTMLRDLYLAINENTRRLIYELDACRGEHMSKLESLREERAIHVATNGYGERYTALCSQMEELRNTIFIQAQNIECLESHISSVEGVLNNLF